MEDVVIEGGFNLGKAKGKGYKVHATTITLSFPSSLVNSERDIYDFFSFSHPFIHNPHFLQIL